jgi:chemotaxis protein MotB
MIDVSRPAWTRRTGILILLCAGLVAGCSVVPRARIEESQQLAQSLRAENARLKDQVLTLQGQNRDYADRALDDLRRLTARDEAIERLERSVQAYQDDRDRLAGAYQRLALSLGRPGEDGRAEPTSDRPVHSSTPGAAGRGDPRGERRAEGLSGQTDGGSLGSGPRSSADGTGP